MQKPEEQRSLPRQEQPDEQKPADKGRSALIDAEMDREIVTVFVEEAEDMVSSIEESVHAWQSNPSKVEFADRLKRDLHTLKGGARMAGFNGLGECAHNIETLIDETKNHNKKFFKDNSCRAGKASKCLRYCSPDCPGG